MYPKNAASPPRIAIGAIYQISDGAKQTSGASATVTPQGGSETAAGGTLACLATSGEWVYTPTQAETNYTAFVVSVYKASCTSASVTVVTTAGSTAGKVTVESNEDKTGYTASTVSDKSGYSLSQAFPSNFAALGINASGHISRVTLADTVTTLTNMPSCPTDWLTAAGISAAAVAKIEAALINEGDGQALIDAIVQAIDAADIENDVLPALIRDAILNRVLSGNHDTAGTVGKVMQDIAGDVVNLDGAAMRGTDSGPTYDQLEGFIQLICRKDAAIITDRAALLAAINADEGSGAGGFDPSSDSLERAYDVIGYTVLLHNWWVDGGRLDVLLDAVPTTSELSSAVQSCKLAADGLDSIAATESSGKPTTFPGWIMWLVQRFRRSSKTPTAVKVETEAGATVTTQTITDDGAGTETLGPPS